MVAAFYVIVLVVLFFHFSNPEISDFIPFLNKRFSFIYTDSELEPAQSFLPNFLFRAMKPVEMPKSHFIQHRIVRRDIKKDANGNTFEIQEDAFAHNSQVPDSDH